MTDARWTVVHDLETWDETLLSLPTPHVLQSAGWGEFKGRWGWLTSRYVLQRGDRSPRAAAQILRRPLSRLPWAIAYVPKGPVADHDDSDLFDATLAALERTARRQRCVFIKIDPDVPAGHDTALAALTRRGWIPSTEQIQFRNTALLDIRPSEEDVLSGMKSKTRYNVRLSRRRGVIVRAGGADDLETFYALYAETANRDGFPIRPFAYYDDVWSSFLRAGLACFLLAFHEGRALAGLICFRFGERAWYMYGASGAAGRRHMPNHLLQWEAIRWAKGEGCTVYDLWGAPDVLSAQDPMWGVWRFKEGLGARYTPQIGAWDFVVSQPLYWTYRRLRPRLLAWLRRRHISASPTY